MKKLSLPVALIALLLITSCAKYGSDPMNSSPKPNGDSFLQAYSNCGEVFTVLPEGPDTDTQNLLEAFASAKAAGPGSTVRLVEGNYYIGFMEIREFFGSFVGAGQGKTIISFKGGLDCSSFYPYGGIIDDYAVLVKFIGGDIYMGEMTLQTPAERLCLAGTGGHQGDGLAMVIFADRSGKWDPENIYVRAWVNNVEFLGGQSSEGRQFNIRSGMMVQQCGDKPYPTERAHDDIKVTNCRFDHFQMAMSIRFLGESTLIFGEKDNGNIFNDCKLDINMEDNMEITASIAGNTFNESGCGICFADGSWGATIDELQTKQSIIDINQNEFNIKGTMIYNNWTNGIYALDRRRYEHEDIPTLFLIKNNEFNFSGPGYIGLQLITVANAVVRNNKFEGEGIYCIYGNSSPYIDGTILNSENILFLGNNFSNSSFEVAPIILGSNTSDCTVIGGGTSNELIVNMGTNNHITGVNISDIDGQLGQTIKDNLELVRDALMDPGNDW